MATYAPATPLFTPFGVEDQQDLNANFYWDYVRYADPYNLYPPQTPWECATPIPYLYSPKHVVVMPAVHDPYKVS